METKPLAIHRNDPDSSFIKIAFIIVPLIATIVYRGTVKEYWRLYPFWSIVIGFIYLLISSGIIYTAWRNVSVITVYNEGIEFHETDFYPWEMIESFKTIRKRNGDITEDFLVLVFKEYKDLKIDISKLDKTSAEIADIILRHQQTGIIFTGHMLHHHA